MGSFLRSIAILTIVIAGSYVNAAFAANDGSPARNIEQRQQAWRSAVARILPPRQGCFTASYPITVWRQVRCVMAPSFRVPPRATHQQEGVILGNGSDYVAVSKTPISFAVGHFPGVKELQWETGKDGTPNVYSLQLNSDRIPNDPLCSGASDPKKCLAWAQFVFLNGKKKSQHSIYIQYWLIHYGDKSCPGGGWGHPDDPHYKDYCYLTIGSTPVPPQPITELPNLILSGGAVAQGLDTVSLITKTQAYSTTAPDNTVFLANAWSASEFNVFGDGNGDQAIFNPNASLAVEVLLTNGSNDKPKCQANAGTTAETNNLNLGECSTKGGMFPSIKFTETQGTTFAVLHLFQGGKRDGAVPYAGVVMDGQGNLYGTTFKGGGSDDGTVFKLARDGVETLLHSFTGSDGSNPNAGVILDGQGNVYGTTTNGGGTVFKLAPDGTETILHSFSGGDGATPYASVIMDGQGNLYGTTAFGGRNGDGTVFKLTPDGTETVLHSFAGSDGANPFARVIMDGQGNLYGTTFSGGVSNLGAIFKLAPDGTETVLHSFSGSDGRNPYAGVIMDVQGNLYGMTYGGGGSDVGAIFKLAPDGTETVLHSFSGSDGAYGNSVGLVMDNQSNIYGTMPGGGASGDGLVFRLAPDGTETVLHSFVGSDGVSPYGGVFLDGRGDLYGTASNGGKGDWGTVFRLSP